MDANSQSGTYKRSTPEEIAYLVKELRTHYDWKQLALAHEAGVNVKTIERIEAGERVSDETLVKVAKALKLRDDALTAAHYSPSDEEAAEMLRKAKEDYTHTSMHDLSAASDFDNILSAQAYLIDGDAVDDSLAERVASVKDYVQDAGDVYDDACHANRVVFCRELLEMVRDIEAHGYTARWGRYTTADGFRMAVLVFFRTEALETTDHFRFAIVPRFLISKVSLAG
jgi:transcriptional regulator with XRE-family HTH domain